MGRPGLGRSCWFSRELPSVPAVDSSCAALHCTVGCAAVLDLREADHDDFAEIGQLLPAKHASEIEAVEPKLRAQAAMYHYQKAHEGLI